MHRADKPAQHQLIDVLQELLPFMPPDAGFKRIPKLDSFRKRSSISLSILIFRTSSMGGKDGKGAAEAFRR
jgi:hypothetical protein